MMDTTLNTDVILSVYIISFLIGFPSNVFALYAFSVRIHSKPCPTDILLLNLTVSDLLFLIFLPLKMHEAMSDMIWTLPTVLCSISTFIFFSTIYTSSLLLMAVSVVRYIGIAFPISYHLLQRPVYAIMISAVIWIISAAQCSIAIIVKHHPALADNTSDSNGSYCFLTFSEKQLDALLPVRAEAFFVLCLVPLLVCVFCYFNCIWILYRRSRISPNQKRKAIGMALGTLSVFLVCVIPYNVSHLVSYFQGVSPLWRDYTLLFCSFNTCIDPIIFYFSSSTFHCTGFKSIFNKRGLTQFKPEATRSS